MIEIIKKLSARKPWHDARFALWAVTLLSGGIFWLSAHPPMIDIPQHAGQVALLLDLLHGDQSRQSLFYVNYFTPYLLGYSLWCLLALALPLTVALKVLLTVTFWSFVLSGISLRRQCQADARLDWLMLPAFFGFSFKWGFLTFLIAAPLGILFIAQAMRYAKAPDLLRGLALFAAGLVIFFCHGLIFIMCLSIGGLLSLIHARSPRVLIRLTLPYLTLLPIAIIYFIVAQSNTTTSQFDYGMTTQWLWQLDRIIKFIAFPWGDEFSHPIIIILSIIVLLSPLLLECQINKNRYALIPFGLIFLIWLAVPHFAMKTFFLYERFSLFILPFYALLFIPKQEARPTLLFSPATITGRLKSWLLPMAVTLFMVMNALQFIAFDKESRDFEHVISKVPTGGRALALILDSDSKAARNPRLYTHYASWYQAEHRGIVDFNFAWFAPQPIRYRADALPSVKPGFEWAPKEFNWLLHDGQRYDFFFLRSITQPDMMIFLNNRCTIEHITTSNNWHAYRKGICRNPPQDTSNDHP